MIFFLVGVIVFGILVLFVVSRLGHKVPVHHLNKKHFQQKWIELLNLVKTPEGMILAVIDADKLMDEALRRRHFKGTSMGERLVSAQRSFSNNDDVWHAHKLRNRLVHETDVKIKQNDAKNALESFKQGLRDLGAL
jgi:hypothetical protein